MADSKSTGPSGRGCQLDEEQLREGEAWIRSLARSLVRSEADLDDLVQETLLIAMQSPPSHQDALKGWFRKVVRNQVYFRFRTDTRRKNREKWVARSTIVKTDTTESLEKSELRSNVRGAVSTLKEPYRTTLVLHYFHRQTTAQIATQMRVSDSAVRMRLSRSYSQLKDKLDGYSNGNRNAVVLGLIGLSGMTPEEVLAGTATTAAASTQTTTGAALSTATLATIGRYAAMATAVVLFTVAALWLGNRAGDRTASNGTIPGGTFEARNGGNSDAGDDGGTLGFTGTGNLPDSGLTGGGANVELAQLKRSSMGRSLDQVTLNPLTFNTQDPVVELRVVSASTDQDLNIGDQDQHRRTLVDAKVFVCEPTIDGSRVLDSTYIGATDGNGKIQVPRQRLEREHLLVIAEGHVEYRENVRWRALGNTPYEIVLDPQFAAAVEVRRPDGSAVSGASIEVTGQLGVVHQGTSNEEGRFEFVWTEFEPWIQVHADGYAATRIRASAPTTLVELVAGHAITGAVVDPQGWPLADCTIEIETTTWKTAEGLACHTDAAGRFATPNVALDEELELRIRHPEFGTWSRRLTSDEVRAGVVPRVELQAGALLQGVVWGPDRQPVAEGHAILMTQVNETWEQAAKVSIAADGTFVFDNMAVDNYLLWLEHPSLSSELAVIGELAAGTTSTVDVTLNRGAEVTGRVVDEQGNGVSGVTVRISHPEGKLPYSQEQVSGPDGSFRFRGVPTHAPELEVRQAGQFHLLSRSVGEAPAEAQLVLEVGKPFNLLAKTGAPEIEWLGLYGYSNTTTATPGETDIELVLADEPGDPLIRFRVQDTAKRPVRTPVYLLAISPEGWASAADTDISGIPLNLFDPTALNGCLVWMMPDGYAWQCQYWDERVGTEVEITAQPRPAHPVRIRATNEAGEPLKGRHVFVCPQLADSEAFGGIFLGNTDEAGILDTYDLAPGDYKFLVSRGAVKVLAGKEPGYTGFRIKRWNRSATVPADATTVTEIVIVRNE